MTHTINRSRCRDAAQASDDSYYRLQFDDKSSLVSFDAGINPSNTRHFKDSGV
jgi:hypothetical protein